MDLREVLRMKASPTLWAEVESLREQLRDAREACLVCAKLREAAEAKVKSLERWKDAYAKGRAGMVEQADLDHERAKAAEAKLAEEKELRAGTEAAYQDQEWWLGDALDALGIETVFEIKGAKAKLAEERVRWADAEDQWRLDLQAVKGKLAEAEKRIKELGG